MGSKNLSGPTIGNVRRDLLQRGIRNDIGRLFEEWSCSLQRELERRLVPVSARDLYRGPMWKASLEAFDEIRGDKELWVMSCGFGLLNGSDKVCGYHATFKGGEEDSIYSRNYFSMLDRRTASQDWWNLLATGSVVETSHPCSIEELVRSSNSNDVVMLVAGKDYWEAIYLDLARIRVSGNLPRIVLVGIKRVNDTFKPEVPRHLHSFVRPYTDRDQLRGFLSRRYGCNMIQIQSKSALHLIRQYNETGEMPMGSLEIDGTERESLAEE